MLCTFISHPWNGRYQDFYTLKNMKNYSVGVDSNGLYTCG